MENQDLIVVKQLPIIEQRLKQISEEMDKQVEEAKSLVCTEESKQIIKDKRTALRKLFERLENERKTAKEQIMKPYAELDTIYKEFITDKFNQADNEYKNKINAIEVEQKKKLEDGAREYFEKYKTSKKIDFIIFENMNLKVGLSDNPTKLKKQVTTFIDKVKDDLDLIETQDHKAEILIEYKQSLNVSNAITTVMNRFKAVKEERTRQKQQVVHIEMNENHEITKQSYEELEKAFNKEMEETQIKQKVYTITFKVTGTAPKLKQLKDYLIREGYQYE